ncbi:MAG: hypothetical protein CM1200mP2_44930 [Planctomycetaceae bacterium]|nr:MAG: hypothetical protein CM1200mP2_44930 [Planctomycetaceae bacterium]
MTELPTRPRHGSSCPLCFPGWPSPCWPVGAAGSAFAADSLGELRERMVRVNIEAEGVRDKRVFVR